MPLRDHFREPQTFNNRWDAVHAAWPTMIAVDLNGKLPERYVAGPRLYLGSPSEIDVAAYERLQADPSMAVEADGGVAVATAVQAPPLPTLAVATELPDLDEFAVLIHDLDYGGRLVAAIEIVSPANTDRPDSRRAFVGKCGSLLLQNVGVAIVDPVTTRRANLYGELLEFLDVTDPSLSEKPPGIYAASCRRIMRRLTRTLEAWAYSLELGRALPTLPLWLDEDFWVPLDLESTYEQTCKNLRMR